VINGTEEDLRTRLKARPTIRASSPLCLDGPLPTGRVMVKDENVCLHCSICAERCPTSAWEMQKFTLSFSTRRDNHETTERVNDFVIRFANVNGSGSASANNLFAKAVFRMGVPVSPKNIFPSNIQGLPTWYEVRVNEQGHVGRRGDVDLVVAVNGQTLRQDYDNLLAGGYFIFDSSKPLPETFQRDDITVIGIPMTQLCNETFDTRRCGRS
jgi:ferredoxin